MQMLKRLNKALPGLVLGIIIYGVLLQVIGMWFVDDRLRYTTGLWIGIGCAVFMAVHMAVSIEDAVCLGTEHGAKRKSVASAMTRYLVVLVVLAAAFYFRLGMILPAFLGIFGLKISAYMQMVCYHLTGRQTHQEHASEIEKEQE